MRSGVWTLCGALALALLSSLARAQAPQPAPSDEATLAQAKQHFETGKAAYNAGDYLSAIREFKAAEALRPSPILDYNIGLANEKLGRRRVAVKYYRRYLEGQPQAPNRAEVDGRIATLEREIAAAPPAPANQPQVGEQAQDMPPQQPPPQPQASTYDPYGYQGGAPPPQLVRKKRSLWWVPLVVIGGALVVTGAIVWAVLATDARVVTYALTQPGAKPAARGPAFYGATERATPPPDRRTPETLGLQFRF